LKSGGTSTLVHVGYCGAAIALAVMGWMLFQATRHSEESNRWVDHTFQALALSAGISESLGRAESASRGYVLFAEASYLDARNIALANALTRLDDLIAATRDNPQQQLRTRRLAQMLGQRATLMRQVEQARRGPGGLQEARALVAQGSELSARTYAALDEIRAEELRLLADRRAEQASAARTEEAIVIASILLGLAVLAPAYLGFLRESRTRGRLEASRATLAESLPGAVFQYRGSGGAGRYEFVTASSAAVCGVPAAEVLRNPRAILDSMVEEDREHVIAGFRRGEEEMAPVEVDYRVGRDAPSARWLRINASPRRSEDGALIWSGLWSDITEKRAHAEELRSSRDAAERANRAKSTFLATMSHEIRTPMNGVLGMLELLAHSQLAPDQRATLTVIRESARALLRIIDDILDFSRIEAGKLELRAEPASVPALVERVRDFYAGNASSRGIALTCSADERIRPALWLDPVRVQQILANLVSNAIKFTPSGSVHIRAELAERLENRDIVRFSVADTGIGIAPEESARLFEPFSQVPESGASGPVGSGLGLSICKRLAELMDGTIEMQSQPGRGTTIYVTLRLESAPGEAVSTQPREDARGPPAFGPELVPAQARAVRAGTRVLVVDDHPINRMVLERQVVALGYVVETAANGHVALERWRRGGIAAVVTDCNMPGMDGYQLTRRIRETEAAQGTGPAIVIACTANAIAGDAGKCLEAGMDDYLAKPVELYQLERKLTQWLPLARTGGPIEHSNVSQLARGNPALEFEVMRRFAECHGEDVRELRQAAADLDFGMVVGAAHRIKGATRTIGAMGLASICERIEHAGRGHDAGGLATEMENFDFENLRLGAYLKEFEA
jgi:signal transduction histidine kinase/CheY-like chemotaxis protein/CHASE3 domain sensor protein/HPt (histidine-containing phosphotransfer) domain-containing protein